MRRDATRISQPSGLSGSPSAGHCVRGGEQRLLHRVLGVGEVAVAADDRAEGLRRQLAQQALGVSRRCSHLGVGRAHHLAHLDRLPDRRRRSGPGAADACAAISIARSSVSTSIIR